MRAKCLYGKVAFNHDATLLILTNKHGLMSYKLINSLCKEKISLRSLDLTIPLPDHKWEIMNLAGENLNISNDEEVKYFRNILESSETKNADGEKYYEILSIEII